jgi:hypothetical protein
MFKNCAEVKNSQNQFEMECPFVRDRGLCVSFRHSRRLSVLLRPFRTADPPQSEFCINPLPVMPFGWTIDYGFFSVSESLPRRIGEGDVRECAGTYASVRSWMRRIDRGGKMADIGVIHTPFWTNTQGPHEPPASIKHFFRDLMGDYALPLSELVKIVCDRMTQWERHANVSFG